MGFIEQFIFLPDKGLGPNICEKIECLFLLNDKK